MRRSLALGIGLLLFAAAPAAADQDTERPRRVEISRRAFLGVELSEVTRESAQRLRLKSERGALIENVTADSSAEKAGLKKDDVIVNWNGAAIESAEELSRRIRETPAGRTVQLGIIRDGNDIETSVTLGERSARIRATPAVSAVRVRPPREIRVRTGRHMRMGVSLQGMSSQLAEYFGLSGRNGALVLYVHPDSPAAKGGLKAGDVILSIGGEATDGPSRAYEVLSSKPEGPVEVRVMRDKQERTLTIQLEKAKTSWLVWPDEIVIAGPEIDIAPLPALTVEPVAPVAIPELHIPRIRIPQIDIHRVPIPDVRVVVPYRFRVAV